MIVEIIKKIVQNNQNSIAYKVNNDIITYKELYEKCNYYSKLLIKQGSSPVILYGGKEIENYIAMFSCLFAGRTYAPIGLCTPIDRLKAIVEMSNSNLIITNENIVIDGVEVVKLNELTKYSNLNNNVINNDNVYIIFTSGSTGEPKGVPISKENLTNFISWISSLNPLCDYKNINVLNQANFSFDLSVADIYYSICNGHTLVAYDGDFENDFDEIFRVIKDEKIDVAVMTPTLIKICLINPDFNSYNYPSLKCIYFCGEILENKTSKKLLNRFPNINIINAYGPTEATSAVSAINITKEILENEEILPIGKINESATEIVIENDEIVLKGKSVFSGYLGNVVGGYYKENGINCYKTGDLGHVSSGKLYYDGRKDFQVKYKGYRIELNDIENNINKIRGITSCAAIAKYNDEKIVKSIKAFVVVDGNINEEYIKNELRKIIPGYMMPKVIKIIDKMPFNNNGKIDRKKLEEL